MSETQESGPLMRKSRDGGHLSRVPEAVQQYVLSFLSPEAAASSAVTNRQMHQTASRHEMRWRRDCSKATKHAEKCEDWSGRSSRTVKAGHVGECTPDRWRTYCAHTWQQWLSDVILDSIHVVGARIRISSPLEPKRFRVFDVPVEFIYWQVSGPRGEERFVLRWKAGDSRLEYQDIIFKEVIDRLARHPFVHLELRLWTIEQEWWLAHLLKEPPETSYRLRALESDGSTASFGNPAEWDIHVVYGPIRGPRLASSFQIGRKGRLVKENRLSALEALQFLGHQDPRSLVPGEEPSTFEEASPFYNRAVEFVQGMRLYALPQW